MPVPIADFADDRRPSPVHFRPVMTTSWFALVVALSVGGRLPVDAEQNFTRQHLYTLVSNDSAISSGDVTETLTMTSLADCAVYCTSVTWCQFYAVEVIGSERMSCLFTSSGSPATISAAGSAVYGVVNKRLLSSDCTDPPLDNSSLYTCNNSPTFQAAAMLRMGSNRAIVFTSDNQYIKCSAMNNIVEQGAEYCASKLPVVGDPNIDPAGDRFATGPPDGAVGYIRSNMVECRYYLFKGNLVYCYQHTDNEPWMTPCSDWKSKTIQERFGDDIPSDVDDVFGNFDYNHDFYFVKENIVYLSTGDAIVGRLAVGYPKHVHELHPNFVCDITGVQRGLNTDEYYYTRGRDVFKEQAGVLYYKRYLCH